MSEFFPEQIVGNQNGACYSNSQIKYNDNCNDFGAMNLQSKIRAHINCRLLSIAVFLSLYTNWSNKTHLMIRPHGLIQCIGVYAWLRCTCSCVYKWFNWNCYLLNTVALLFYSVFAVSSLNLALNYIFLFEWWKTTTFQNAHNIYH